MVRSAWNLVDEEEVNADFRRWHYAERGVGPGVVVDVALPEVLFVRILVGLVVVGERWMVVLVGVCSHM